MVEATRRSARGEIWWIALDPVVGREQAGKRPALILSADAFQRMQDHLVVIAPMTRRYTLHIATTPEDTGLPSPGAIMCDHIRTISTRRLLDSIPTGRVSSQTMRGVDDLVSILLNVR